MTRMEKSHECSRHVLNQCVPQLTYGYLTISLIYAQSERAMVEDYLQELVHVPLLERQNQSRTNTIAVRINSPKWYFAGPVARRTDGGDGKVLYCIHTVRGIAAENKESFFCHLSGCLPIINANSMLQQRSQYFDARTSVTLNLPMSNR